MFEIADTKGSKIDQAATGEAANCAVYEKVSAMSAKKKKRAEENPMTFRISVIKTKIPSRRFQALRLSPPQAPHGS